MQESIENYQKVYRMLEDRESKDTYMDRLAYLISDDYKYIEHIITVYLPDMLPLSEKIRGLLRKLPPNQKIVLYGAGGGGARILQHFVHDERFIGFCSNNTVKQRQGYLGYPVMSPEELLRHKNISVLVYAPSAKKEIMQLLHDGGYPEENICDCNAVVGEVDHGQYFDTDFISYEEEEVFVDAGCYHLEDTLRLQTCCKRLKKAYAFEPDPANYRYCLEKVQTEMLSHIEVFPFGTWSERRTLSFSAKGNTSSKVCSSGEPITVVPIDDLVQTGERVTFIKMDVEGAELESLKGAEKTICRDRPKLAVCIYHKREDMVEIPLFIKKLVPDYKLYVRMHANDGNETVL